MKHAWLTGVVATVSILVAVLCFVSTGSSQTVSKRIELANFPNPPVEILSVKLGNKELDNEELFVPTPDWTSKLEVTVKNVSTRPVSFVAIYLYAPGDTDDAEATFGTTLEFWAHDGVAPIQPGENAKLKHTFTHGNILDSGPARIQVDKVEWENDPVNVWMGGKMWIIGPNGEYSRAPKGTARYVSPSDFVPRSVHKSGSRSDPNLDVLQCRGNKHFRRLRELVRWV